MSQQERLEEEPAGCPDCGYCHAEDEDCMDGPKCPLCAPPPKGGYKCGECGNCWCPYGSCMLRHCECSKE